MPSLVQYLHINCKAEKKIAEHRVIRFLRVTFLANAFFSISENVVRMLPSSERGKGPRRSTLGR